MKKLIFFLLIIITVKAYSQTDLIPGMTPTEFRTAINNNFYPLYKLYPNNALIVADTASRYSHFMGYRKGGDSIIFNVTKAGLFGTYNKVIRDNGYTIGNATICDGYMSASIGTQSICSADDALATGNESVAGSRLYQNCTLGYDGNNYIQIPSTYGDQSDQFINSVDSASFSYSMRMFWDYPYFYTNKRTRDFPTGIDPGLVRLFCDSVKYDGTYTKVYYNDSITSSSDVWITGCSINALKGTANITGGRRNSTQGESAYAFGINNRAWNTYSGALGENNYSIGQASLATGQFTQATGQASLTQGYTTTATGDYSSAFGEKSISKNRGAVAFGLESQTDEAYFVNYSSAGKFDTEGDNQGGFFTKKIEQSSSGSLVLSLLRIEFNSSYTLNCQIAAIQTSSDPGRAGIEGASYSVATGVILGNLYVMDSVNLTTNRIYYTGDSLEVNDKLAFNTWTDSTMTTDGSSPGGLPYTVNKYVRESDKTGDAKWITVSATEGGAETDITTFNSSLYNTFSPYDIFNTTMTLNGRSFENDGDDVGNGTTTGVRIQVSTHLNRYRLSFLTYGLTNRTVRWGVSVNYNKVQY